MPDTKIAELATKVDSLTTEQLLTAAALMAQAGKRDLALIFAERACDRLRLTSLLQPLAVSLDPHRLRPIEDALTASLSELWQTYADVSPRVQAIYEKIDLARAELARLRGEAAVRVEE